MSTVKHGECDQLAIRGNTQHLDRVAALKQFRADGVFHAKGVRAAGVTHYGEALAIGRPVGIEHIVRDAVAGAAVQRRADQVSIAQTDGQFIAGGHRGNHAALGQVQIAALGLARGDQERRFGEAGEPRGVNHFLAARRETRAHDGALPVSEALEMSATNRGPPDSGDEQGEQHHRGGQKCDGQPAQTGGGRGRDFPACGREPVRRGVRGRDPMVEGASCAEHS